jgi:formate hydrogenlyase subunit 3/multisubunit Na+/H+ antiporter MnhD subunit
MTDLPHVLLVATLLAPLALLAACFVARWRMRALALQWLAAVPALCAGVLHLTAAPSSVDLPALGFTLRIDPPGAMLLTVAAVLWIVVGAAVWRDRRPDARFGISWLLTMTGSLGVFVAGDLVSFYLFYALVSIPAYGLFALDEDPVRKRAGAIYMAFAILGEAVLLLAFVALAASEPNASIRIADVVAALPTSPWPATTLALLIAGFGMKLGMIPFNGWMPLNYAAAPIPVAAVLSGAGVKAGVIGLIRFLPLGEPLEGAGEALAFLGFLSAFAGVALGLTQRNPKTILAYSSISQMGVIAAALGMALTVGEPAAAQDLGFYGANHLLVKSALFLVIGALAAQTAGLGGWRLALAGALALSLAGLPFTGGALAKLATKAQFVGAWAHGLATLSSIGSAWLMTHFLMRLGDPPPDTAGEIPAGIVAHWPALALGAILLPWVLYPAVDDVSKAFDPAALWDGVWPVALGVGLALAQHRIYPRLPEVPPGDAIIAYEAAFRRLIALGPTLEKLDDRLRQWPAAGVSFLLVILALLGASLSGG